MNLHHHPHECRKSGEVFTVASHTKDFGLKKGWKQCFYLSVWGQASCKGIYGVNFFVVSLFYKTRPHLVPWFEPLYRRTQWFSLITGAKISISFSVVFSLNPCDSAVIIHSIHGPTESFICQHSTWDYWLDFVHAHNGKQTPSSLSLLGNSGDDPQAEITSSSVWP